jgi:hypothetical protein
MKRLLLLFLLCSSALGATRYVDSAATGSADGTSWANAWTTLAAITGLSAGDTVYISGGTTGNTKSYTCPSNWNPPSGTVGNRITYQIGQTAAHNGVVIFSGSGTWLTGPTDINLSGDAGDGVRHFRLTGCALITYQGINRTRISYLDCPSGLGVAENTGFRLSGATAMEVDHCYLKTTVVRNGHGFTWHSMVGGTYDVNTIHDNTILVPYQGGGLGSDGMYIDGDGFSIYNNLIQAYYVAGANGDHADGWQGAGGRYIKIYNNVIVDFANYGLFGEAYASGYQDTFVYNNLVLISDSGILGGYPGGIIFGANVSSARSFIDVVIANNTIVDLDDHMAISLNSVGSYPATFTDCYIQNNVIVGSGSILLQGNTTSTVDHNVWITSANAPANFATYTHYGGTANNLHLLAGASTLVDTGASMASWFTTDKDGYTRTGTWDIGAYEYGAGGPPDTTPPSPDPMTWSLYPTATSSSAVTMTASTATDAGGGVQYYFDETSGHAGGSDSGWQVSATYTDSGLSASTLYTYRVKARDASLNETAYSSSQSATTDDAPPPPDTTPPTPDPMTWYAVPTATSTSTIVMTASVATDPSGVVQYYFHETTGGPGGSDSGWQVETSYIDSGLTASTLYTYQVKARDPLLNETTYSATASATTDAPADTTAPTPDPMTWFSVPAAISSSSITMTATTATDAGGTVMYYWQGTLGGHNSGWQTDPSYTDVGLNASTLCTYQVKARDPSLNETAYSSSESATTDSGDAPGDVILRATTVTAGTIGRP